MNREILFRGKRLDNGEWVYGDLLQSKYSSGDYKTSIMEQTPVALNFPVYPETVGQYTGLKDKNGVKVFEGDIMVFRTGTTGVVVYSRQRFIWQGYPEDPHNPMGYFSGKWQDDFEVIGDIHNNAELLEVE